MRLREKTALVTGAARGIGAAAARALAAEGARVMLTGRRDEEGTAVAREIGEAAAYRRLDVLTAEQVAAAIVYLASDESAYITGSELRLDGGILAGSAPSPDR